MLAFALLAALAVVPASASALILSPTTVDGPDTQILEFGGIAMAPDGTGGLVYTKAVEGVPHVFASRYDGRDWSPPVRVDQGVPYDASQPRIAAGEKGALMVVWVTQTATVQEAIQRGLYSASLGPGANGFGAPLLVDPNVGDGTGVDPSLAGVAAGRAIVAYRVVTEDFTPRHGSAIQLRPGDVLAEIRLARFAGDRWSRIPPINRNPAASMRAPTAANGPQVAIGASGNAVVIWQEPDQSGAARIWVRRIFGTTPGPVYPASPSSWEGKPVTDDAESFALDVTAFDQARIASRVAAGPGSALGGPEIFLTSLASSNSASGAKPEPLVSIAGGGKGPAPGPLAAGSLAASGEGGAEGTMRAAFSVGGGVGEVAVDESGKPVALPAPGLPMPQPGAAAMTAVDPVGGGVVAYPATVGGEPTVVVRQDFPSGAVQSGTVSGEQGGPVSQLAIGRAGTGDALIGFRQGEPGHYEIVAERVSAPPAALKLRAPSGWVRPRRAKLAWFPPRSAVGSLTYSVLVNGRTVKAGLRRRAYRPEPAQLGDGVSHVQILASDGFGGEVLSRAAKLKVDGAPPRASVRVGHGAEVSVSFVDRQSGLVPKSTSCAFGDGTRGQGGAKLRHTYAAPGRYVLEVRARDRVGNRLRASFEVRVR